MVRRLRIAVLAAIVAATIFGSLLRIGSAALVPSGQLAPPLPVSRCDAVTSGTPCTGNVPAATCIPASTGQPNSWDAVDSVTQSSTAAYTPDETQGHNWYTYRLIFDPWTPCLLYRLAPGNQRIDRSDDAGAHWRVVLDDTATGPQGGAFHIADVAVLAPHTVFIAEDGAGDAVITSSDGGSTWRISNAAPAADTLGTGLAGNYVAHVAGDPAGIMYATVYTAASTTTPGVPAKSGVYLSIDGGNTWSPSSSTVHAPAFTDAGRTQPDGLPVVGVDPLDSRHAFYLNNAAPDQNLQETGNGGATWTQRTVPKLSSGTDTPNRTRFYPFVVAHSSAKRPTRLYAVGGNGPAVSVNTSMAVNVSDDGGQTWNIVLLTAVNIIGFAADPLDQDRAMYIAQPNSGPTSNVPWTTIYTDNGFATQGLAVSTPRPVDGFSPYMVMAADRQHRFYLSVDSLGTEKNTYTRGWYRYNPALPNSLKVVHPGGLGGCTSCASVAAPLVFTCAAAAGGSAAQSLAFDGRYLYYTNHNDDTADGRGTIHRVEPATCAQSAIRVRFDGTAASAGPGFDPAHPGLDELTYDPKHNVVLAETVRRGEKIPPAVFAVTITDPGDATHDGSATATLRWVTTCIVEPWSYVADTPSRLFAYDQSDDTIWGCDRGLPGHLNAAGGAPADHCFGAIFNANDGSSGQPDDAWGMGAPNNLWVQYGGQWHDFDMTTCELTHLFQPRPGPGGSSTAQQTSSPTSDAQIVCDSVSFQHGVPGLAAGLAAPGVMMWARDSNGTIDAFDLGVSAGAFCPLPTALRYVGPSRIDAGQAGSVCPAATLLAQGRGDGIAGQPVSFSVDGIQPALTAMTSSNGATPAGAWCLDAASLAVGTHHIAMHYAGTGRTYLPADATADLVVLAAAASLPPPPPPGIQPHHEDSKPPTVAPPVLPPVLAPQGGPQGVAPPQPVPQPPGQQLIQLQVTVTQKEEQHQLAFAYNAADAKPEGEQAQQQEQGQPPRDEKPSQYAMSALPNSPRSTVEPALAAVALAGTLALVAGLALRRRPQESPVPSRAIALSATRRATPRHRRR